MIHFSTEKGFSHHIKGPTYEIMAETVLFVCATAQVISDGTGEPLTSVALDFIKAISNTITDDEQIEQVKRMTSGGKSTNIKIDIDALRDKE